LGQQLGGGDAGLEDITAPQAIRDGNACRHIQRLAPVLGQIVQLRVRQAQIDAIGLVVAPHAFGTLWISQSFERCEVGFMHLVSLSKRGAA
jgi:hypothetical protein